MTTRHSITVEFKQLHDLSLRAPLVERLQRIDGVVSAVFDPGNYQILTVTFRDDSLSEPTLLDFLEMKGMSATVLGDNSGAAPDRLGRTA